MKDRLIVILKSSLLLLIVLGIFFAIDYDKENKKVSLSKDRPSLTIFGDNIDEKYSPVIENDKIYLSLETLDTFIDDTIFYDESSKKIIITNEEYVYKFSVNSNQATRNMQNYDVNECCKTIDDELFIDMEQIKDIYNVKTELNEDTNTFSIDKKDLSDINLNYNNVQVYDDIRTNANVIDVLDKTNTVFVYVDSLKHNRWYKVKTDSGKIGYIDKAAVTVDENYGKEVKENDENDTQNEEKVIAFWQYGSKLETLGDKLEGVNVAMPTWFEVSDVQGGVDINYSRDYYNKAKENGYELWPVITNGFGNEDTNSKEATSKILNDESRRDNLIKNIIGLIKDYKLDGINIDFENMKEEDKYMYTQFLRELYPMVNSLGAKLSVDVYFTNYIDRKGVGKACDYFILMGYDQRGNWSKEPGSIAEVSWVEKNISSLIDDSDVAPSKIILGVPLYTRLWKIDDEGEITTNVYSMKNSEDFVNEYNLTKVLDEESGQNYVEVVDKDITYKLWIEDMDSVSRRADTVNNYNLAGIATWQKEFAVDDIWQLLNEKLK